MTRAALATAATAAALILLAPGHALAAPQSRSPFGFAISPEGSSSYFMFRARPGATVHGVLRVINKTPAPKTVLLYPADVGTAATGGLQYADRASAQRGRWVSLARTRVRISGDQTVGVAFAVRVPATARPGEHFTSIVARNRRVFTRHLQRRGTVQLRVIPRLAMTISLRTPGRLSRAMKVGRASIAVAPSGASLELGLANHGNALITAVAGRVTISQGSRDLFRSRIQLGAFVPHTAIAYHVPWRGMPVAGTYTVHGQIIPAGAAPVTFTRTFRFGATAIKRYHAQTGRPALQAGRTPTWVLVVLALAIGVAATFAAAYTRTRRQLAGMPRRRTP
jgi:hypothetical protein